MTKPRYLTKSRFKLGYECVTKLFYTGKRDAYVDLMAEDSFLQNLAEGGYQVGELAKYRLCTNPATDGIETLDYGEALRETARRMASDPVTIAEAAFHHGDFFIRADIVRRDGNVLDLYEVKSKSWEADDRFWQKRDPSRPDRGWLPYLLDIAFQKHVVQLSCPGLRVKAHLVLVDKARVATVDGLNQMFKISRENGRIRVSAPGVTVGALGADLLVVKNVDPDIDKIWRMTFPEHGNCSFVDMVGRLASVYARGEREWSGVGARCASCQFRYAGGTDGQEQMAKGLKSGREECWQKALGNKYQAGKETVLGIWGFRGKDALLAAGKYYLADVKKADLGDGKQTLRQWMQVDKARRGDTTPWLDKEGLRGEMNQWTYPLHFIDFETSRVAIPFNKGRGPYEQIAFQFSHHTVQRTGEIRHEGEWLEVTPGTFPNFGFVRALKRELEQDAGSIFCYSHHENTVLNEIYDQLEASREPDRDDLCRWIRTITVVKQDKVEIEGPRAMVDMRKLVLRHHYDPHTQGSNSLKAVLPAILHSSSSLREKYSAPIYGTAAMPSRNFRKHSWIQAVAGNDPYKTLPSLFDGEDLVSLSAAVGDFEDIAEGGEAMTAYAKLQFSSLPDNERTRLKDGLLRYCELDTLAMVMLYEYWKETV